MDAAAKGTTCKYQTDTSLGAALTALALVEGQLGTYHPLRLAALIQADRCVPSIHSDLVGVKVQMQAEIVALTDALHGRGSLESAASRLELALTLAKNGTHDHPSCDTGDQSMAGIRFTETAMALAREATASIEASKQLLARHSDSYYAGLDVTERTAGKPAEECAKLGFLAADLPRPACNQHEIAASWISARPTTRQALHLVISSHPPAWAISTMEACLFEVIGLLAPSPAGALAAASKGLEALARPLAPFLAAGIAAGDSEADAPVSLEYATATWEDATALAAGQACKAGVADAVLEGLQSDAVGAAAKIGSGWSALNGTQGAQLQGDLHCRILLLAARSARRSYREALRLSLVGPSGEDKVPPVVAPVAGEHSH